MGEFINKHSIKIQLGVLAASLVLFSTFIATAYSYVKQIEINTVWIEQTKPEIGKIVILTNSVDEIKSTLKDVRDDVKYLIRNNK